MSFDLPQLADAVKRHGRVARVLVAGSKGSVPRDTGTAMLVWDGGSFGTIGGGTLEYQAVIAAVKALGSSQHWHRSRRNVPLGPALGQCCGGAVTLLTEVFSADEITALQRLANSFSAISRPLISGPPSGSNLCARPVLANGHVHETLATNRPPVWIYGAGHVGRALVRALLPLGFDITWIDTDATRFPPEDSAPVTRFAAKNPADAVPYAPSDARHLVMSYSHALDLEICHAILSRGFLSAGLIGSKTKWARFSSRLAGLGHSPAQIARIACPIGMPELGKAPEFVALGVATTLLRDTVVEKSGQKPKEFAI